MAVQGAGLGGGYYAPNFIADFVIFCTKSRKGQAIHMAKTDRSPADRKQKPTWLRFSGIGVEFAGVVIGFTLIGLWIDRHYNKSPWGVVIGASLGLVGGMYNLIRESLAASRDADAERKAHTPNGGKRHEP